MHDTDDEDVNATPVMHDHVIAELLTDYVRNRCGPHIDVHRFEHVVMVDYTIGRYELFVLDGCVKVQVSALRAPYRTFDEMIWRAKLEFADPAFFDTLDLLLADIAPQIPLQDREHVGVTIFADDRNVTATNTISFSGIT